MKYAWVVVFLAGCSTEPPVAPVVRKHAKPVEESRKMVKAGKELGIEIKYIEVPGGDHTSIAVPAFKDIFDWFDAHKRQPAGAKAAAKAAGSGQ